MLSLKLSTQGRLLRSPFCPACCTLPSPADREQGHTGLQAALSRLLQSCEPAVQVDSSSTQGVLLLMKVRHSTGIW